MQRVAIYGEAGSYSEQAARERFGKDAEYLPYPYISDLFKAVGSKADFGMVPIENSIEGGVTQTYDELLASKVQIVGEHILRIKHCLIANPGVPIERIRRVYSHPQALGQCKAYLQRHRLETIPYYDTAGSVRMIRDDQLVDAAAVAGERAAALYRMSILARDIETDKRNYTRFFILAKRGSGERGDKTSIVFMLKSYPGALYHALDAFAYNKVNLTHILSRPVLGKPWQYNFYLDIEGDGNDPNVRGALRMLKKVTISVKVLGSYKKAKPVEE